MANIINQSNTTQSVQIKKERMDIIDMCQYNKDAFYILQQFKGQTNPKDLKLHEVDEDTNEREVEDYCVWRRNIYKLMTEQEKEKDFSDDNELKKRNNYERVAKELGVVIKRCPNIKKGKTFTKYYAWY